MAKRKLNPVHPGEVLFEEFLKPLELSQNRLALDIGVPPRRINEIVLHKRAIGADTALRLARYFRTTPQFWMGLQTEYDLDVATDKLQDRIKREVRPRPSASTSESWSSGKSATHR
jgi:antitoxin HigA-1